MRNLLRHNINDDISRYAAIGGAPASKTGTVNLIVDHRGYRYSYDYKNLITEIKDSLKKGVVSILRKIIV